jgi:hypothetical protein
MCTLLHRRDDKGYPNVKTFSWRFTSTPHPSAIVSFITHHTAYIRSFHLSLVNHPHCFCGPDRVETLHPKLRLRACSSTCNAQRSVQDMLRESRAYRVDPI